jgi:hypothetical protein
MYSPFSRHSGLAGAVSTGATRSGSMSMRTAAGAPSQVELEYLAELRGRLLVEHAAHADGRAGHADVQPSPPIHGGRDDRVPPAGSAASE